MLEANEMLLEAAMNGHTETVTRLLDKDAALEHQNKYGNTALLLAAMNSRTARP